MNGPFFTILMLAVLMSALAVRCGTQLRVAMDDWSLGDGPAIALWGIAMLVTGGFSICFAVIAFLLWRH
jgi:hypothetical protein